MNYLLLAKQKAKVRGKASSLKSCLKPHPEHIQIGQRIFYQAPVDEQEQSGEVLLVDKTWHLVKIQERDKIVWVNWHYITRVE